MKRLISLILIGLLVFVCASAANPTAYDEIKEKPTRAGGVYKAYPSDEIRSITPAPEGYTPFYISHYGRHGSRFLIKQEHYTKTPDILEAAYNAGALTDLGNQLRGMLVAVSEEAANRAGDLTPLGARQHRDIAARMVANYPAVFSDKTKVFARCTISPRCAMSMAAFTNSLLSNAPDIDVSCEMSERNVQYLNYHTQAARKWADKASGPWVPQYNALRDSMTHPDRLVNTLFADSSYVNKNIDAAGFMRGLFEIAIDLQNMEADIDLLKYFTTDELYDLWQISNFSMFAQRGNHPGINGMNRACAHRLVRNITECADRAILLDYPTVDLRFGHDGNIIPLLELLMIDDYEHECGDPYILHEYYRNYKAVPMAANIQFVFFRNMKDSSVPILVKVLHNENEVTLPIPQAVNGFYDWAQLRQHMIDVVSPYTGL